jgi:hypothetical protein
MAEGYPIERPFDITTTGEPAVSPGDSALVPRRLDQVEADSAGPTAAWPAASRAVSTRNGEQET